MNRAKKLLLTGAVVGLVIMLSLLLASRTIPSAETKMTLTGGSDINVSQTVNGGGDTITPSDSPSLNTGKNWGLLRLQAEQIWGLTRGQQTTVAVLDTGIDREHVDLRGRVVAEVNFSDSQAIEDIYGHGTHIAGIIAGGGAGVAPEANLMNVKVADDRGRSNPSWVARGIVWAVNHGADVINISIELTETSPALQSAVDHAVSRGVLVVAAAGNRGSGVTIYPAYYDGTIAVAAIDSDNAPAPLTNRGDWIDVAAPGFNVYSTLPGDTYGYRSGTSFATAYVSGLASLLSSVALDRNGNGQTADEVRGAIERGCRTIDVDGMGAGGVNAPGALLMLKGVPD